MNGGWTCPRCGTTNEEWRNWCQSCTQAREQLDLVFALKGRTLMTFEFLTNGEAITADVELQLANEVVDRAPAN